MALKERNRRYQKKERKDFTKRLLKIIKGSKHLNLEPIRFDKITSSEKGVVKSISDCIAQ